MKISYRISFMDIPTLKAFLSVASHGSFSIAAQELHLTQPAVSKRIALLEEQLGIRLFDRVARNISLTEYGQRLVPRARHILRSVEDTKRELLDATQQISGPLSLAISHHIGLHRLPPALRQFSVQHPTVALDIRFTDSEAAYAAVLHGDIELAVITLAPTDAPQIASKLIWPDPLCFVAGAAHALTHQRPLSLVQLSEYPAILPGETTYTGLIIKSLFARQNLELTVSMATNYLETIKMMASIGLGWSILPATMLDDKLLRLQVTGVDKLERRLGCIYHRDRQLSNAAKAFMDALTG